MKKSFIAVVVALGIAAVLGSGCSSNSVVTNRFGEQIDLKVAPVTFAPEITFGEAPVTGTSTCTVYWGLFKSGDLSKQATGIHFESGKSMWGTSGDVYQRAAVYDACVKANADILVVPQHTTTTTGSFFEKTVTCTVKGFPGYLKAVKVVPSK